MEFAHKYGEKFPLDNLKEDEFLSLAIKTSSELGWVLGNIIKTGFIAYTNNGMFSWNAEIKINVNNGFAVLQSRSWGNGLTDVKGNKKNLQNFISAFKVLKETLLSEEPKSISKILKTSFVYYE